MQRRLVLDKTDTNSTSQVDVRGIRVVIRFHAYERQRGNQRVPQLEWKAEAEVPI